MDVREIRHFHLFAGLGGGAKGFNRGEARLGTMVAKFRCLGGIDVDPGGLADFGRLAGVPGTCLDLFTAEQFAAFHGKAPPAGWREATPEDIRRAAGGERPHIVFTSPPCLPANGIVLTLEGAKEISSIRAGDLVLTHRGRFREVTHVGTHQYTGTMHGLRLNGTVDRQWFTGEHPLWVRRVIRNLSTNRKRVLDEARFMPAEQVEVGDRIGFPVDHARSGTAAQFMAGFGDPRSISKGGMSVGLYPYAKPAHVALAGRVQDLRQHASDPDLWFLLGCYLGDGYRRAKDGYEVSFCVGAEDGLLAHRVTNAAHRLGLSLFVDRDGGSSNVKLRVTGKHLWTICGAFGDGAENKHIPPNLFGLEDEMLAALVAGYRATDGSEQDRRSMPKGNTLQARWKIASVSLQLLRDFQRLLLRQGIFASINKCWPGGEQVIMGRTVQTMPRWELNVRLDPVKRTVFEFADGAVWVRVRDIERRQTVEPVWNLSVADDDTFCAPMMATHNCKGFSGLLPEARSRDRRYQALNQLAVRGVWLALEAWADDPPELFLLENVPRIANRGRPLLDQITALLRAYGYLVAERDHDCGRLGGLAQTRKRFLLVARHAIKCPPFLYEPVMKPLRSVGQVLDLMPLPGDPRAGPIHRVPSLQYRTWVRLAFVEAGSDWRSLEKLAVQDGYLRDFAIAPSADWHRGVLGVNRWEDTTGTVAGESGPTNGRFSVADPRPAYRGDYGQLGVVQWQDTSHTVGGQTTPGQGWYSVADPRPPGEIRGGKYRVNGYDEPAGTVIAASTTGNGAFAVADPRPGSANGPKFRNCFRVIAWDHTSQAVTGGASPSAGGLAVQDPRWHAAGGERATYQTAGQYGVVPWDGTSRAVTGAEQVHKAAIAVADPRTGWGEGAHTSKLAVQPYDAPARTVTGSDRVASGAPCVADPRLPEPGEQLVAVIQALDGTWHRPFTTFELAALQGLVNPHEHLELAGLSDADWRERIGNAVPPPAAQAIASVMGSVLLRAWSGEGFMLSAEPIWVQPILAAYGAAT